MKYKVKVGGHIFEVELSNLHSQPIIALVEGEAIEVWLEDARDFRPIRRPAEPRLPVGASAQQTPEVPSPKIVSTPEGEGSIVRFPIPGVIISLSVREGDEVSVGQELCVLEAMKMKNVIRAPHAGKIAAVRAVVGQAVKHHDVLLEFGE
jgi:biotin carboxyl carrier protein